MKSIVLKKLSLYLSLALLFCSLPVVHVEASSVTDQSKPIFGLTADDVVEKYNQLSDQQKEQVLKSLGNTSIFANSLFGNIFNSTFGALGDAIEKIGDLFFQANGVVYKLGSSALAWVSRLIDKVFNDDLSDLNISQPVVDDLCLNTRGLSYNSTLFFTNNHLPTELTKRPNPYLENWNNIFPLKYSNFTFVNVDSEYLIFSKDYSFSDGSFCLIVDCDLGKIFFNSFRSSFTYNDGSKEFFSYSVDPSLFSTTDSKNVSINGYHLWQYYILYSSYNWNEANGFNFQHYVLGTFTGQDYVASLYNVLDRFFVSIDNFVLKVNNRLYNMNVLHSPETYQVTNNTYYNYIYNIPDQTPLNVTNIVSNTAINYDPVENLIQYLPDNYNIEQNFSVVNNYYISSGPAISSQGSIDVNLVSPSVIDVRIINPEDISSEVINENNNDIINNYDFDFGDLNINNTVGIGIDNARDNLSHVVTSSSVNVINGFASSFPPVWQIIIFGYLALGFIVLLFNKVIGK